MNPHEHTPPFTTDVHSHFLTDRYVAEATDAGITHPDNMPQWPSWTAERHLALMDRCGIRRALLSISSPGIHFGDDEAAARLATHVNDAGAALARSDPQRFGHLAALPLPAVAASIDEARRSLDELGSDGVGVLTNHAGRYLGHPTFEPLWHELDRRAAVVFVHPTSPPHADAVDLGRPRPMLEFIVETARAVSDLAGTPFPHQVPATVAAFGADRLLCGSDACRTADAGVERQVASIDAADPPPGDSWRALVNRNADALLRGGDGARHPVDATEATHRV